jgi:hypothetical protein
MKYNIMDAATLGVFDLNHAPTSAMKATDCGQHRQVAGAFASIAATHFVHGWFSKRGAADRGEHRQAAGAIEKPQSEATALVGQGGTP